MNNMVNNIDLDKLPEPYLESHPEWVELYDFAWRLAAKNIRECERGKDKKTAVKVKVRSGKDLEVRIFLGKKVEIIRTGGGICEKSF